jgi:hypothetical protein
MQAHKLASNKMETLECVPEEFRAPGDVHKVLGLIWDTQKDDLLLNVKGLEISSGKTDSPRVLLETSAKIFDPLGLAAPFVMKVKLLFQEIGKMRQAGVKTKDFWDNPVAVDIQERWNDLKKDISQLEQIRVPRYAFVKHGLPQNVEIFAFGDASKQAYASVIYIVATHNDG